MNTYTYHINRNTREYNKTDNYVLAVCAERRMDLLTRDPAFEEANHVF